MNNLILLGTIIVLHLLAAVSPGPDFLMAARNSLTYSRKTGVWTAVGFGSGIAVHIFYCVLGLAVLISKSIVLFNAIKFFGAFYLIYLGVKSILARSSRLEIGQQTKKPDISAFAAWRMGFLTNVLNPKATLFFLGLFTFVVSPQTPWSVTAASSFFMILDTVLWFSLVAVFFTNSKISNVFSRFQGLFNKFFGGLLILVGAKVALSHK